mmetsp:Transcript_51914/g.121714  ORF Transcript_51914/g.121714 Transcript_51914/m.121714 type:complete len:399 (-) Transcript_51914:214-1410(-)
MFLDEKSAFWTLSVLCEEIFPNYYSKSMVGTQIDQRVMDELCLEMLPSFRRHVTEMHMQIPMICTRWFLCVFVDVVPTETMLRIWDVIFSEGSAFVFQASLGLLKLIEEDVLSSSDLEQLMAAFTLKIRTAIEPNELIHTALSLMPETEEIERRRNAYYMDVARVDRRARDDSDDDDEPIGGVAEERTEATPSRQHQARRMMSHIVERSGLSLRPRRHAAQPLVAPVARDPAEESEVVRLRRQLNSVTEENKALVDALTTSSAVANELSAELQVALQQLDAVKTRVQGSRPVVAMQGYLEKRGRENGRWQRRYFVLRDCFLCYYKSDQLDPHHPLGIIPLSDVVARIDVEDVLHLVDSTGRSQAIRAPSLQTLRQWLGAIGEEQARFLVCIAGAQDTQ